MAFKFSLKNNKSITAPTGCSIFAHLSSALNFTFYLISHTQVPQTDTAITSVPPPSASPPRLAPSQAATSAASEDEPCKISVEYQATANGARKVSLDPVVSINGGSGGGEKETHL